MKDLTIIFFALIVFYLLPNEIKAQEVKTEKVVLSHNQYITAEFTITGMACQTGCADAIQKNIENLQGVKKAEISYEKGIGTVLFDNISVSLESITHIIEETKVKNYTYSVENTTILKN